ncbi:MAG: T9SS type A sorting domain-containing protein [bacterium]|nr:T9SS type A sorting domain-containing protein [bacterium]
MKKYLILLTVILLAGNAFASAPDTAWTRTFGDTAVEEGKSVQQTSDGGYIACGYTCSYGAGGKDAWLVKTDANGNKQWDKIFGIAQYDLGTSVRQTTDGGYIMCGTTSGGSNGNIWLIKTDNSGNKQWDKTFGGSGDDFSFSVKQTSDGGYIITGETTSFGAGNFDVWLIKTNSLGDTMWTKVFGGTSWDIGHSVLQANDGGYIVCGGTGSFGAGDYDVWIIKTDANGNKQWDKTFGTIYSDGGASINKTTDGGYIICGSASPASSTNDLWLIKIDSLGNEQWDKLFGGSDYDYGGSAQQTTDGGYIACGITRSFGVEDIWLIKTNPTGDTLWTKVFGGSDYEYLGEIQQTSDGGYIVCGTTDSYGINGAGDMWLIKIGAEASVEDPKPVETDYNLSVSQNPFSKSTVITYHLSELTTDNRPLTTLCIYDLSGRCVKTLVDGEKKAGSYSIPLSAKELKTGVYFLTLTSGTLKITKKITIIR